MLKLKAKYLNDVLIYQGKLIAEMQIKLPCRMTQHYRDDTILLEINWCQQWIKKNKLLI
jgi:hypothetical protein